MTIPMSVLPSLLLGLVLVDTGGGRSGKDEGGAGGDTDPDKPTAGDNEIYAVGNVDVYGDVGDDLLAGAVVYGGEGEDTLDALASEYSPIFVDFVSGEDVIAFDVVASNLALSEVTIVNSPPGATYPTRLNCASTVLWSKRSGWVVRLSWRMSLSRPEALPSPDV